MPPPRGVGRQPAVRPLERAVLGEGGALAALAEAVALERQRDQRAERVVELRDRDVGGLEVARSPTGAARTAHDGPRSGSSLK